MASKSSKKEKHVIFEKETPKPVQPDDFSESKPSAVENIISVALGLAVVFVIGAMIINVIRNRNAQPTTPEQQETQNASATISAMYTVQAGDTLWSIAEKHYNDGFKYPEIEKANNMNKDSHLEKGMQIIIPKIEGSASGSQGPTGPTGSAAATTPVKASPTDTIIPSNTPKPTVAPTDAPTAAPTAANVSPSPISQGPTGPTGSSEPGKGQTSSASSDRQYTVVKGDSLWNIAVARYNNGYRWVEIARMNNLKNPNLIHSGNVLLMP